MISCGLAPLQIDLRDVSFPHLYVHDGACVGTLFFMPLRLPPASFLWRYDHEHAPGLFKHLHGFAPLIGVTALARPAETFS